MFNGMPQGAIPIVNGLGKRDLLRQLEYIGKFNFSPDLRDFTFGVIHPRLAYRTKLARGQRHVIQARIFGLKSLDEAGHIWYFDATICPESLKSQPRWLKKFFTEHPRFEGIYDSERSNGYVRTDFED